MQAPCAFLKPSRFCCVSAFVPACCLACSRSASFCLLLRMLGYDDTRGGPWRRRPGSLALEADGRVLHSRPCFSISVPSVLPSSRMKEPTWVGFMVCDWLAHTSLFCCRL